MEEPSVALNHHTSRFDWRARGRAAGIHFGISLGVAAVAALLVFALWYPYPYREVSGGRELFLLVVAVDVILGPLITFAIFNRAKGWPHLRRDLAVVGLLQLAGLGYGLWTVHLARPVHLVFEIERFRVVHAVDIPVDLLDQVPAGIEAMPLGGPTPLAVRPFRNEKEKMDATMVALQGIALAARPDLWQTYEAAKPAILQAAKPVSTLKTRFPAQAAEVDAVLQRGNRNAASAVYLPMIARKATAWTVLLDAGTAEIIGFVPLDSF
ncbi:pilus assembly protein [Caenimonas sedimenti]|uniref:Pilus assembly protein n=1 Tax=Caenimonas sedimenti TaxID=2596921 RepID=A0A562ZFT2_9BURK|nr:TfpX/TfpZ family type IV pilin accessory protein [Caenimonas sedimenti]TWO66643.1 pilus assembly protein [Caenimonas sedimenti]